MSTILFGITLSSMIVDVSFLSTILFGIILSIIVNALFHVLLAFVKLKSGFGPCSHLASCFVSFPKIIKIIIVIISDDIVESKTISHLTG